MAEMALGDLIAFDIIARTRKGENVSAGFQTDTTAYTIFIVDYPGVSAGFFIYCDGAFRTIMQTHRFKALITRVGGVSS